MIFGGKNNNQKSRYREIRMLLKIFPCLCLISFKGDSLCKDSESKKLPKTCFCLEFYVSQ